VFHRPVIHRIVVAVKSFSLDPIPFFLLRECIDVILPFLTAMVKCVIAAGSCCLSTSKKMSVVTPMLKGFFFRTIT